MSHASVIWTKIVWSKLHQTEFSWQKKKPIFFKNHFWQSIDAILEDVSVAETIV